jgi:hypothetical protein
MLAFLVVQAWNDKAEVWVVAVSLPQLIVATNDLLCGASVEQPALEHSVPVPNGAPLINVDIKSPHSILGSDTMAFALSKAASPSPRSHLLARPPSIRIINTAAQPGEGVCVWCRSALKRVSWCQHVHRGALFSVVVTVA